MFSCSTFLTFFLYFPSIFSFYRFHPVGFFFIIIIFYSCRILIWVPLFLSSAIVFSFNFMYFLSFLSYHVCYLLSFLCFLSLICSPYPCFPFLGPSQSSSSSFFSFPCCLFLCRKIVNDHWSCLVFTQQQHPPPPIFFYISWIYKVLRHSFLPYFKIPKIKIKYFNFESIQLRSIWNGNLSSSLFHSPAQFPGAAADPNLTPCLSNFHDHANFLCTLQK